MISIPSRLSAAPDLGLSAIRCKQRHEMLRLLGVDISPLESVEIESRINANPIVNGCRVMVRPGVVPDGMAMMVGRIKDQKPQIVMLDFRDNK